MRIAVSQPDNIKLMPSGEAAVSGMLRLGGEWRRSVHWDIEESSRNIAWLRTAMSSIAKNLVAPGWKFVKVPEFESEATDESLLILKKFYGVGQTKAYKNWKDFYTTSSKMYATAMAFILGNFAAWEVKGDSLFGDPIGFDFIPGFIEPNIAENGDFLNPAFTQYLASSGFKKIEWDDPNDIVFFARPDYGGFAFSSDLESLVQYTLPAEIYAALSWLSMHKNRTAPLDGYWLADPNMSNDDYKALEVLLRGRYANARNYGKAPILARGQLEFKPTTRSNDEMPYKDGREQTRQEITGVTQAKDSRKITRDSKRDYYETAIEPLQQVIEETTYEQVHVRLFGIKGWKMSFNNPAFVNEVEQASIDRTYWNIGVKNADEIRGTQGLPSRKDGKGNVYYEPTNMVPAGGTQVDVPAQGGEPGQSPDTLDPSEGDPTGQKPRPVRADEQSIQDELRKWKTLVIKIAKGERKHREFQCTVIPEELADKIRQGLKIAQTDIETIKMVFELAANSARRLD